MGSGCSWPEHLCLSCELSQEALRNWGNHRDATQSPTSVNITANSPHYPTLKSMAVFTPRLLFPWAAPSLWLSGQGYWGGPVPGEMQLLWRGTLTQEHSMAFSNFAEKCTVFFSPFPLPPCIFPPTFLSPFHHLFFPILHSRSHLSCHLRAFPYLPESSLLPFSGIYFP